MEPFAIRLSRESSSLWWTIFFVRLILYLWHLAICEHFWSVCGINDPGHTWDEYSILAQKLGMTPASLAPSANAILLEPSTYWRSTTKGGACSTIGVHHLDQHGTNFGRNLPSNPWGLPSGTPPGICGVGSAPGRKTPYAHSGPENENTKRGWCCVECRASIHTRY
jgi:hypothetical protein